VFGACDGLVAGRAEGSRFGRVAWFRRIEGAKRDFDPHLSNGGVVFVIRLISSDRCVYTPASCSRSGGVYVKDEKSIGIDTGSEAIRNIVTITKQQRGFA
jgi:hypothetical protein